MSLLICLGNLTKMLFLDSHAMNLQVRTYLDVFMASAMPRSLQDLPRLCMFHIKMYQVSFHWAHILPRNFRINFNFLEAETFDSIVNLTGQICLKRTARGGAQPRGSSKGGGYPFHHPVYPFYEDKKLKASDEKLVKNIIKKTTGLI